MTDEFIAAALGVACKMCKAPAGVECSSIIDGKPLPDRRVHYFRIDRPMEKGWGDGPDHIPASEVVG